MHGRANGAPGHGGCVSDEVQCGGMKGLESQADHEGSCDGHGRSESGATFDKCAKAESHQQQLQTAIGGDTTDGRLHDFEVSGVDRNIVEKDSRDYDPYNVH